jgi:hypothetical protein
MEVPDYGGEAPSGVTFSVVVLALVLAVVFTMVVGATCSSPTTTLGLGGSPRDTGNQKTASSGGCACRS